ncbi:hypothetical protein DFJ73DRAFT_61741 [Zopfochytrium polystomum]|nr:hypothetical protein DFJ73DRAFT_61741 [Zopfochytrium polystomum]
MNQRHEDADGLFRFQPGRADDGDPAEHADHCVRWLLLPDEKKRIGSLSIWLGTAAAPPSDHRSESGPNDRIDYGEHDIARACAFLLAVSHHPLLRTTAIPMRTRPFNVTIVGGFATPVLRAVNDCFLHLGSPFRVGSVALVYDPDSGGGGSRDLAPLKDFLASPTCCIENLVVLSRPLSGKRAGDDHYDVPRRTLFASCLAGTTSLSTLQLNLADFGIEDFVAVANGISQSRSIVHLSLGLSASSLPDFARELTARGAHRLQTLTLLLSHSGVLETEVTQYLTYLDTDGENNFFPQVVDRMAQLANSAAQLLSSHHLLSFSMTATPWRSHAAFLTDRAFAPILELLTDLDDPPRPLQSIRLDCRLAEPTLLRLAANLSRPPLPLLRRIVLPYTAATEPVLLAFLAAARLDVLSVDLVGQPSPPSTTLRTALAALSHPLTVEPSFSYPPEHRLYHPSPIDALSLGCGHRACRGTRRSMLMQTIRRSTGCLCGGARRSWRTWRGGG